MTDEQIEKFAQRISELVIQGLEGKQKEKFAQRISELVIQGLEGKQKEWDNDFIKNIEVYTQDDEEQSLLTDLATYMTQLDFNLQQENYTKCDELKKKIIKVEKQLNKFK